MHDTGFIEEKRIQFEKDAVAFNGLSPRQQNVAEKIAAITFGARRGIVTGGRAIVGAFEAVFNLCFYLPYQLLAKGVRLAADFAVGCVKGGIAGIVGFGRACLATGRGMLSVGEKAVDWMRRTGLISEESKEKSDTKIESWREKLFELRDRAVAWGKRVNATIDQGWKTAKTKMAEIRDKAAAGLEYYGALGLYKGTKWLLNPRLPSGKPLFISEPVNKAVGLGLAVAGFGFLAYQLSKLTIFSKILHVKLAASFLTDPASLVMRMTKQITLHPAITLGVTALKFVTLPMIAATRQALKTTPFTQGVAYQYNKRLHEKQEKKLEKVFAREVKDRDILRSANRSLRKAVRICQIYMRKQSFAFLGKFIEHIVEKASPEFYEGRIKYYQDHYPGGSSSIAPAPVTPPSVTPSSIAAGDTRLGPDFKTSADKQPAAANAANANAPASPASAAPRKTA